MGELAPEFKQKIANFDGNASANNQERDVIFYLESYTQNMPPEYLNKLIDAIKMKLRDKELNKDQIYRECGKAIKELNEKIENEKKWKQEKTFFEKIDEKKRNIETGEKVRVQLGLSLTEWNIDGKEFSDKWLLWFSSKEWWNYFISIQDFEAKLENCINAKDINSKALTNYFKYLNANKILTPQILINKFWGNTLLGLGILWQDGRTIDEDGRDPLLAKKTLEKSGLWYIVTIVQKLSSGNKIKQIENLKNEKELDVAILLLQAKENKFKTEFINEIKNTLVSKGKQEPEITIKATKLMQDLLNCRGKEWVVQASRIIAQFDKENNTKTDAKAVIESKWKVQSAKTQRIKAETVREQLWPADSTKLEELRKKMITIKREEREQREENLMNKSVTVHQREDLVSWKKNINQVIEELKKEDKNFANEYKTWQKEKEKFDQENSIKETSVPEKITPDSRLRTGRGIPFDKIDSGKPHTISLDRRSDNADTVTIMCHRDSYIVQVGNNIQNTTELTKEKIPAYVQSLRFMEKLWLGYFIRNLPANKLSQVLENTSRGSVRVNNKDGDFDIPEKKRIIASFGKLLDIPRTDNVHPKDGPEIFQNYFKNHTSLENILYEGKFIQNGTLQIAKLEKSLKSV